MSNIRNAIFESYVVSAAAVLLISYVCYSVILPINLWLMLYFRANPLIPSANRELNHDIVKVTVTEVGQILKAKGIVTQQFSSVSLVLIHPSVAKVHLTGCWVIAIYNQEHPQIISTVNRGGKGIDLVILTRDFNL